VCFDFYIKNVEIRLHYGTAITRLYTSISYKKIQKFLAKDIGSLVLESVLIFFFFEFFLSLIRE